MKKLPVVALVLLALAGVLWALSRRQPATRSVSGTIETDEVLVASRYGGRVEKIFVEEGDSLPAGEPIAELDAAELRARRDLAAAQLQELRNGPRPEEIAAALAERDALAAQLEFARTEATRANELFAARTISATERDQATSRAEALIKSLAAADQRYLLLKTGTRREQIEQAQARHDEIEAQLAEMRVTAPGGTSSSLVEMMLAPRPKPAFTLEVLHIKVGDVLAPNQPVATLLLPDRLWVRVYVPELWLGKIQVGQQVRVRVDSFDDRDSPGEVVQVNRAAEFTPRNVQTVGARIKQVFGVKVRLPANTGALRAGMAADVFFPDVPPIPK